MFIAVTRVKLPKEPMERMAEAFRRGAQDLKQFPGFLGFELWLNEDTLEAVSRWESREAMEAYSRSDIFQAHHGGAASAAGHGAQGHGATGAAQGHGAAVHSAGSPGAAQIEYYNGEVVV